MPCAPTAPVGGRGRAALRVDGGMTASEGTMQFLADILGAPVERPVVKETTALGAAYLAGRAAGLCPDLDGFAAQWRLDRRFVPQMSADERARKTAGWKDANRAGPFLLSSPPPPASVPAVRGGREMTENRQPLVRFERVTKRFGAHDRGRRSHARYRARRILRAARAVGLRQDDAAAHARGLRDADSGPHPARRRGHRRRAAAPAAGEHDVPELRAVSAFERRKERRLRAASRRVARSGDRPRVEEMLALVRLTGFGAPQSISSPAARSSASRWRAR